MRLIPPQYVKPFVKRGKNDRNDAEAICEAAGAAGHRIVLAKTAEQQARGDAAVGARAAGRQRTQLINALRGHAAEIGLRGARRAQGLAALRPRSPRPMTPLPAAASEMLAPARQADRPASTTRMAEAIEAS